MISLPSAANDMAVRIGIDGRDLSRGYTGIARYVAELCKVLNQLLPHALFFIYSNRPFHMPVESPRWLKRVDQYGGAHHLHELVWLMVRGRALCEQDRVDVFWGAMTILPPLRRSTRAVVTVYDLIHMNRELVTLKRWLSHRLLYRRSLSRAHSIMAISETTAEKLYNVLGYRCTTIVRPGISEQYRPYSSHDVDSCLRLFGIQAPYIFAVVSSCEPRKNLRSLLEAFSGLLDDKLFHHYSLVLAGPGGLCANKMSDFTRLVQSGAVRSLGHVRDAHLALLYRGSAVSVCPSTHEGFGLPVLEARACGTSVVATDIPELREAGGKDAIYTAPSADGIRAGIIQALTDVQPKTIALPLSYRWEHSGARLAQVLLDAAGHC